MNLYRAFQLQDKDKKRIKEYFDIQHAIEVEKSDSNKKYMAARNDVCKNIWKKSGLDMNNPYIRNFYFVCAPLSYDHDINIVFFMINGYQKAAWYELNKEVVTSIEDIQDYKLGDPNQLRGNKDRHNADILEYYPFEIKKEVYFPKKRDKYKCSGWCELYQKELFAKGQRMEIFSINKENDDITRYAYFKNKEIYENLKGGDTEKTKADVIENLLALELSLGYILTNKIYPYVKDIKTMKEFDAIKPVIGKLCEISCVEIRYKIAEIIMEILKKSGFYQKTIDETMEILNVIVPRVNHTFMDLCMLRCFYTEKEEMDLLNGKDEREELSFWWDECYDDTPIQRFLYGEKILEIEKLIGIIDYYIWLQEFDRCTQYDKLMEREHLLTLIGRIKNPLILKAYYENEGFRELWNKQKDWARIKEELCSIVKTEKKEIEHPRSVKMPKDKLDEMKVYAITNQHVITCILNGKWLKNKLFGAENV